jgi:hypothetical protein
VWSWSVDRRLSGAKREGTCVNAFKFRAQKPIGMLELARHASQYPVPSTRLPIDADHIGTITTPYGAVDLYSRDPAFVVAVTGRYVFQIIRQRATPSTLSLMRCALADLSTRYDKFGYVAMIEPEAQLAIPADIRDGFKTLIKRYSSRFTGAAIVYEKTGFQATALRSLVTAMNFATGARHPNHVFADLRQGIAWLSKLTAPEPTPAALVHVVQMLRQPPQHSG